MFLLSYLIALVTISQVISGYVTPTPQLKSEARNLLDQGIFYDGQIHITTVNAIPNPDVYVLKASKDVATIAGSAPIDEAALRWTLNQLYAALGKVSAGQYSSVTASANKIRDTSGVATNSGGSGSNNGGSGGNSGNGGSGNNGGNGGSGSNGGNGNDSGGSGSNGGNGNDNGGSGNNGGNGGNAPSPSPTNGDTTTSPTPTDPTTVSSTSSSATATSTSSTSITSSAPTATSTPALPFQPTTQNSMAFTIKTGFTSAGLFALALIF